MSTQELNQPIIESAIRKEKYKRILDRGGRVVEECDSNTILENISLLTDLVSESNSLMSEGRVSDRLGHTAEVVLDIQAVKLAHDLMGRAIQKLEQTQFCDDEFVAAINKLVQNDIGEMEWENLDDMVCDIAKTFRYSQSMFGTFDLTAPDMPPAMQKQRAQRKRNEPGIEKQPLAVTQTGKEKGNKKLEVIFQQIMQNYKKNDEQPLPYYRVIIDPENMMYTFDNAFQVAFLFRDGRVAFLYGDDGYPHIRPLVTTNRPATATAADNVQFGADLCYEKLQKMMKYYRISEPMITFDRALFNNTEENE